MASLNKVQIIGNVASDVDLRTTTGGKQVANFNVATNYKDVPEFHRIVVWDKLAKIADDFFVKGKQVYVEGRSQTREWETKDGSKRYTTEIVAHQLLMLGKKGDDPEKLKKDEVAVPGDCPEKDDIPF